ncbi:MAG TPA: protein mraZ [Candidatus Coprenecus stercoravium]|uniref:Transcriptional regulator MraZ n=1 Tax=Candidatus Coprenecus stercoravium TaxID=2840735 RepID=A0A9D2KAB6_9BACT|nr:protein mraZ [Candidatus Coprenecus stercoravium]
MTKFVGEYKARTDDKGRLVFPSAFKALMDPEKPVRLVVKKDLFAPCLDIYTYEEWERESESIKSRLNFFNRDHDRFWRGYMSGRAIVEPDGKVGRITIPRQLLDSIGVEKDVVFAGNDHKIELWARERFEEARMDGEEFVALAEKILG